VILRSEDQDPFLDAKKVPQIAHDIAHDEKLRLAGECWFMIELPCAVVAVIAVVAVVPADAEQEQTNEDAIYESITDAHSGELATL
jgi:hypothetical protein